MVELPSDEPGLLPVLGAAAVPEPLVLLTARSGSFLFEEAEFILYKLNVVFCSVGGLGS